MLVVLALGAAVFYGAGDFLGGFAARRAHALAVALVAQTIGLVALLLALPFFPATFVLANLLWGIPAGICGGVGIALFYHSLSIGKMGVLSPFTAVLAAALPVIAGRFLGERLSATQAVGIVVSLVAIVLIYLSTDDDGKREFATEGLREAVLAGFAFGGFYVFLARSQAHGGLELLTVARVTSISVLALIAVAWKVSLRGIREAQGAVVAAGLTDMTANVLYVLAAYQGMLSLAAVLTSLYPATTVGLARIVLKERMSGIQWLGALVALVGVACIAWRR